MAVAFKNLKSPSGTLGVRILPLGIILLMIFFFSEVACQIDAVQSWSTTAATGWNDAYATFYGGEDASGTMGGACGYGDLYSRGYGIASTALSNSLFNNGLNCGACYQLVCKLEGSKWCYGGGKSITVTATNACPPGSFGGWCDVNPHFDLSYPMFTSLAQAVGGVIPVKYKRVLCRRQGGIRFTIDGNPWFDNVLVHNVGGSGDIKSLSIRGEKSNGWISMVHNWGQFWSANEMLVGQSLSFKCTTAADGRSLEVWNMVPKNWAFRQTFEATDNFS